MTEENDIRRFPLIGTTWAKSQRHDGMVCFQKCEQFTMFGIENV